MARGLSDGSEILGKIVGDVVGEEEFLWYRIFTTLERYFCDFFVVSPHLGCVEVGGETVVVENVLERFREISSEQRSVLTINLKRRNLNLTVSFLRIYS